MSKSGKGSAYEREVCRQLSLWWTAGTRTDVFWRTSNSGGRATVRGRKGLKTAGHYGDIGATDACGIPFLKFVAIEVKRGYSRFSLMDLLDKSSTAAQQEYEKWIEQAQRSQQDCQARHWMVIVRRDKRLPLVLMDLDLEACLYYDYGSNESHPPVAHISFHRKDGAVQRLAVLPLGAFLRFLRPHDIEGHTV